MYSAYDNDKNHAPPPTSYNTLIGVCLGLSLLIGTGGLVTGIIGTVHSLAPTHAPATPAPTPAPTAEEASMTGGASVHGGVLRLAGSNAAAIAAIDSADGAVPPVTTASGIYLYNASEDTSADGSVVTMTRIENVREPNGANVLDIVVNDEVRVDTNEISTLTHAATFYDANHCRVGGYARIKANLTLCGCLHLRDGTVVCDAADLGGRASAAAGHLVRPATAALAGAACNDHEECTTDSGTHPECTFLPRANGVPCARGAGTCTNGHCFPIAAPGAVCNDFEECTRDSGTQPDCEFAPIADGTACKRGFGECSNGHCVQVLPCDDHEECTTDTGTQPHCAFAPAPDGTACAENAGQCVAGHCFRRRPDEVICNDYEECTTDTGTEPTCVYEPRANGTACLHGLGECVMGVCVRATPCNDHEECTTDEGAEPHCTFTPRATGSPCAHGVGQCIGGHCFQLVPPPPPPPACNDYEECTHDEGAMPECTFTPRPTGTKCAQGAGHCVAGRCFPTPPAAPLEACDDHEECTDNEGFEPHCAFPRKPDASPCLDGHGTCIHGRCVPRPMAVSYAACSCTNATGGDFIPLDGVCHRGRSDAVALAVTAHQVELAWAAYHAEHGRYPCGASAATPVLGVHYDAVACATGAEYLRDTASGTPFCPELHEQTFYQRCLCDATLDAGTCFAADFLSDAVATARADTKRYFATLAAESGDGRLPCGLDSLDALEAGVHFAVVPCGEPCATRANAALPVVPPEETTNAADAASADETSSGDDDDTTAVPPPSKKPKQ